MQYTIFIIYHIIYHIMQSETDFEVAKFLKYYNKQQISLLPW